ncbi:hypothetical protein DFH06DRAFT_449559 [Mycena polygramma]|nr:hypothetical protein DFH06DRAFT_449559 [Mycena polygramma]
MVWRTRVPLSTDTMAAEAEEAAYEPESYDAGMDQNFTDASTSYSPPNEPRETLNPSVADAVATSGPGSEGTITWHPVSTPQQFARPCISASVERTSSNTVMTMPPPNMDTPYEPHLAMPPSYFASQPVPVALDHWRGARYPVAGPSHIQPHLLQNANYLLPSYPMSAATTPSAAYLSLPPTPAAGPSMPPASGPVRKTRTHKSATTRRKTAGAAPTVRRVPCPLINTLSKPERTLHTAAALAEHYRQTPTLQCAWDGCTPIIQNAELLEHLQHVHGTGKREMKTVVCLWGGGCKSAVGGSALKKHVRGEDHLNLKLTCTGCAGKFARRDALGRHLRGGAKEDE